jgi:hypothetical protein
VTRGTLGRTPRRTLGQIFLIPALLGVLSAAGLIFALVADGMWDALSWLALSVPIALFTACLVRGGARERREPGAR